MTVPDRWSVKAVGVSFRPGFPENLHALARAYAQTPGTGEASLVREPENPADRNAVAVIAGGAHVGFLPANLAARLAPEMDRGAQFRVTDAEVLITPEFPERPGLLLSVERVHIQSATAREG